MKKNSLYTYIASSLIILVPVPGRLSYGIILILALNALTTLGILFRHLTKKLSVDEYMPALMAVFLIGLCIILKQLLILYSPLTALTLSFVIYAPVLSSLMISSLYENTDMSLSRDLSYNMKKTAYFSIFAFIIFLFRDIFGYGTISFPVPSGIHEIALFKNLPSAFMGSFWASVPGALVILAVAFVVNYNAIKKIKIAEAVFKEEEN